MEAKARDHPKGSGPDFSVVGIGASAGGVQALLRLFEAAPASPGVAFVVVLHLSPNHASHAHEVIQRVTPLRVRQVNQPVLLEPDTVYVIPPGKFLSMIDGHLRLSEPDLPRTPPTSIDVFFRSLADAHGSRAFAVVLSGSGADGSVGISRVRERGGVTIAQQPDEAEYGEMPRSAIGTGDVDLVLPLDEIIPKVLALSLNAKKIELPAPSDDESAHDDLMPDARFDAFNDVLDLLRARTRHDFASYKRGTIVRRIERRMQVNGLATAAAYRDYLARHSEETPKLLADLLIGVTNFFRDADAFASLENTIIPDLMHTLHGRDKVRAWVPACATGEEAFSIAILLDEAVRRLPHRVQVTVYASDIDERAIAVARSASYPLAIENDVGPARLSQYFTRDGNRYRLAKSLRDTVIFAVHNPLRDPPFSRIDLISCRNVLIYMERRAQKQVLDTFFYALRPHEGVLFLGTAESADFAQELFRPVDKQRRIYRARPTAAEPVATATSGLLAEKDESEGHAFRDQTFFHDATDARRVDPRLSSQARALDMFGPAVVVIRADGTIVHRSARADTFTESVRNTRVTNLFDIVRRDAEERVRQAGDMPADLSVFKNLRILLIEDSEESLTAMVDLLALYDAHVVSSANAADALQKASEMQFDLVVTDVGLPDMDGYRLVSALRKLPLCAAIPIAALTGRPITQEEALAQEAGCDTCLAKPFNLQALADVVHRLRPGR
ncbi:chemotaxis protein CheB [Caballeronia sp. GAFFF1]|uniref:chemotaxis protein CheB n=1 Tax=Caballeronia sp. GAFFF1 TaxID=2921779 RepID=UPI0020292914|nr:chemotaxis protein CheB [Caballeronia sp. GAFFF1]